MTQALFQSKESIKQKKARELKDKAMHIWRTAASEYRELPNRYNELLEHKKASGVKPLKKLSQDVLADYPSIPFLDIEEEKKAMAHLDKWEQHGCLCRKVDELEEILKTSNSMNTMKAWCRDYLYNLTRDTYNKKKKKAMYPERYKNAASE
ncbi:hypothetical protein IJI79_01755 [Candidatus Saccharibacteria bacterium]|nr:hypothetical protein [Candidatus Saccharibacteria bacterium]MBR0424205.1 hypothetical protein [Candidatus Saccharibacteria bacterium]